MSKQVPYVLEAICELCGREGTFDFGGIFYCQECLEFDDEEDDELGEFDEE